LTCSAAQRLQASPRFEQSFVALWETEAHATGGLGVARAASASHGRLKLDAGTTAPPMVSSK